jgi:hypothetical protein
MVKGLDFNKLSENPAAFELLLHNPKKIVWEQLSKNENEIIFQYIAKLDFEIKIYRNFLNNQANSNAIEINYSSEYVSISDLDSNKMPNSTESEIIPINNFVYYLIFSHGAYNTKDDNDSNEKKVNVINLHKNNDENKDIEYINKITFSPFGTDNIVSPLILVKHIVELTEQISSTKEPKKSLKEKIQTETKTFGQINFKYPELLNKKQTKNYLRSVVWTKNNPKPIIDKFYDINYIDFDFDIYVIEQKGGKLKIGDKILKNYGKKYMTTIELFDFSVKNGYKNIIMIDYSCEGLNGCDINSPNLYKIQIDKVIELLKNKQIFSGGKPAKKRQTKKIKKPNKTNKTNKKEKLTKK